MASAIVKEGWLEKLKRGTFHNKWTRFWFRLNAAGELTYYESPQHPSPVEKHKIVVYAAVLAITVGENCEFSPPKDKTKFCLLQMKMRDGRTFRLSADTPDDRKVWAMLLTNALQSRPGGQGNQTIILPSGSTGPYQGQVLARPEQTSDSGFQGNIFLPDHGGYEGRVLSSPGQASAPATVRTETNPDGSQTMYVRDSNPQYMVMNDGPHERYTRRWNHRHY